MNLVPDLSEIRRTLKGISGFRHFNENPYRLEGKDICTLRKMPFLKKYLFLYKTRAYSFFLNDLSLIGFENSSTGYYYYQTPYDNWKDFLELYDLSDEEILRDSDFLVDELHERQNHFIVRYDYDETQYRPGIHPVAHIHLGCDTEIRIGCRKKLKPTSFILFIFRQFYPQLWNSIISANKDSSVHEDVLKSVRINLDNIGDEFLSDQDQYEMYLL